jgi:hypothetical protein
MMDGPEFRAVLEAVHAAERDAVKQSGRFWPGRVEVTYGNHSFKVWAHRKNTKKFRFDHAYQLDGKSVSRNQLIEGLSK